MFSGHDITRLAAFRIARLGMMRTFQHIHLVDEMSVLDNIALGWAGVGGAGLWRPFATSVITTASSRRAIMR